MKGMFALFCFYSYARGKNYLERLKHQIAKDILSATSRYHVPSEIHQVSDLPRTLNGKISEVAIARALNQEPLDNEQALQNPDSLKEILNISMRKPLKHCKTPKN